MPRPLAILVLLALGSCIKVPVNDIRASFSLADAAWFAEEETLFIFYRVSAEQGIGPSSQIEVSWRTDVTEVPFTAVTDITQVHPHLRVDCGPKTLCGSASFKVTSVPRQVGIRLKYHREGAVTLTAPVTYNAIGRGPAHTHRSLIVYGVFEEKNNTVQWRARHQFPTLRNTQVQELGLRRRFRIEAPRVGDLSPPVENPYGYGFLPFCPPLLTTELGWPSVETLARAIFDPNTLPLSASALGTVCARSVVTDATGSFAAIAIARKNPEVRPAFPSLRSPIRSNFAIGFVLRPCLREVSKVHLAMQVQRMLLEGQPEICIDDFKDPAFPDQLAAKLRTRIEAVRADGKDMVLKLAVHHDDTTGALGLAIEKALEQILPFERNKTSPRVSGAMLFDSFKHATVSPALRALVLWCPASLDAADLDKIPDNAQRSCPVRPDLPDIRLGPFRVGNLPVLPTRPQYLTFLSRYSDAQAGSMTELTFLAPERTPLSQNLQVGEFGVATLFNNEVLTAAATDAFSFCPSADARTRAVIFRSPLLPMPLPLQSLPELHSVAPSNTYELGLFWDFPFLVRARYQVVVAGSLTAFSLTVPFGVGAPNEKYFGLELWAEEEVALGTTLLQCTRFCDHPTFDASGVYNVAARFRESFRTQCYTPKFPLPTDGEFPVDP